MRINLKSNGFLKHAELFQKTVSDRRDQAKKSGKKAVIGNQG